ncbi:MAG: GNAT family N-acetyltransferase [Tissierellia bacterium]|nr:GNAT family N-acetyltransferase [Tissierellia bacterium]
MREIKKLDLSHLPDYHRITVNAYPRGKDLSPEGVQAYFEEVGALMKADDKVHFYGLFEAGKLAGVMRVFDFDMNLFGRIETVTGLGFLAVDLAHKKEKMARDLVQFFEEDSLKRDHPLGCLLPFRPDFYKTMGYGFGTKYNRYVLAPSQIPACQDRGDIRYIDKKDLSSLVDFQRLLVQKTHGMAYKLESEIRDLKEDREVRLVGAYEGEEMTGYLIFDMVPGPSDNYYDNNLSVREMAYRDPKALRQLLGFLNRQADQARLVFFNTTDPDFHYLLDNPTRPGGAYVDFGNLEANSQYIGPMYKVFDFRRALEKFEGRTYHGVDLRARFIIEDELAHEKKTLVLHLNQGQVDLDQEDYSLTIDIKLADLSSLYMGTVSAHGLYRLGRLRLDDPSQLDLLNQAFSLPRPPAFNTDF